MTDLAAAETKAKQILDPTRADDLQRMLQSVPDAALADLKHYLMFVGTDRSGHSVVGAMLDAHPHIAIANELNAPKVFEHFQFDRAKAFKVILASIDRQAQQARWNNTGYDYNIAGLSQGQYQRLEVLGDKKAGATSMYARRNPESARRLVDALGPMLRVICVLRNPFDTISAMAHRKSKPLGPDMIRAYFQRMEGAMIWRRLVQPSQMLFVRHEDLVADKAGTIERLCRFVSQEAPPEYLSQCVAKIFDSPNARRHSAGWSSTDIDAVTSRMQTDLFIDVLKGYSF